MTADDMLELRIDAEEVYLKLPLNLANIEVVRKILESLEMKLDNQSKKREGKQ